jgi:hypothetical protein
MSSFGSGISSASRAVVAAGEAARQARAALGDTTPKLAIVFSAVTYEDLDQLEPAVREVVGQGVPIVGGTSGACVFDSNECARYGVSVVLVGGDDLEVATQTAPLGSPDLVEVVPAAESIARAADDAARRGFAHYTCLVFAPGLFVDGEALVAAIRKGAGARAQLAGGLTGDDFTFDRPGVLAENGSIRSDRIVLTGIFTQKPVGISARHGWQAVGPERTVTRADGMWLLELEGRRAAEVWLEDARRFGAVPPPDPKDLALYLANHYELGIVDAPITPRAGQHAHEIVARAPLSVREDGAVQLSASIAEGTHLRVLRASRNDLLRASTEAASDAVMRAGNRVAGALVLACSGRLAVLGDAFPEEPAAICRRLGAPLGGACVFGEIARNVRDADAFFNTTTVVVTFAA